MGKSNKRFQVVMAEVYGDGSRVDIVLDSFDTEAEAREYKKTHGVFDHMHHTYVYDQEGEPDD